MPLWIKVTAAKPGEGESLVMFMKYYAPSHDGFLVTQVNGEIVLVL